MVHLWIGLVALMLLLTASGLTTAQNTLDPTGEGVCNEMKQVEKNILVKVTYKEIRLTEYQSCWNLFWTWKVNCKTKLKKQYYTAYRYELRPTVEPEKILKCCANYTLENRVCIPDCNGSVNCIKNCTNCTDDNAYCNRVTGVCHCVPGFFYKLQGCDPCPNGTYGQNCKHNCMCQGNASYCNPLDGACTCEPGKTGQSCDNVCGQQQWGAGCGKFCNCSIFPCDPKTGACQCGEGWTGSHCKFAVSDQNEAELQSVNKNIGKDIIIPAIIVVGIVVVAAMVIITVVIIYRRRRVNKEMKQANTTEIVNRAYEAETTPPGGVRRDCDMRENDLYASNDEEEYDKLNFRGQFKTQGRDKGQAQDIYSTRERENGAEGMVENDLYDLH